MKKKPAPKKQAKKKAAKRSPAAPKPKAQPAAARIEKKPSAGAGRRLDKKAAFLSAYSICASIKHAAKAAHINARSHYQWLRESADYAARFKEAQAAAVQALEDEATYRAMVGVWEPNVYQGKWIYPQEEYEAEPATRFKPAVMAWRDVPGSKPLGLWKKSDALLMFRLRGEMPQKYRQYGSMELTGPNGGPIEIVERLNAGRARVAALAAQSAAQSQPTSTPGVNDDTGGANYRN